MPQKHPHSKNNTCAWSKERRELISGASGGFLFGIPMLYTMEVWSIGSYVQPPVLLSILTATYAVVFLLNRVEGFRNSGREGMLDAAAESVEITAQLVIAGEVEEEGSQNIDFLSGGENKFFRCQL